MLRCPRRSTPSRRSSSSSPAFAQGFERFRVRLPVFALVRFDQPVRDLRRSGRIEVADAFAHLGIEHEGLGELLVDPGSDLTRRRRPSHRVGHVGFDLAHALVAVLEHALVPFRIEHARAGLERDLLGERAHRALPPGLVADIDRRRRRPWRAAPRG